MIASLVESRPGMVDHEDAIVNGIASFQASLSTVWSLAELFALGDFAVALLGHLLQPLKILDHFPSLRGLTEMVIRIVLAKLAA